MSELHTRVFRRSRLALTACRGGYTLQIGKRGFRLRARQPVPAWLQQRKHDWQPVPMLGEVLHAAGACAYLVYLAGCGMTGYYVTDLLFLGRL